MISRLFETNVAALLAILLAVGTASAGRDETRNWWQSERFKTELGLADQQTAALNRIFSESQPKLRAAKAELDRQEQVLSKLIGAVTVDEQKVLLRIDGVEAARSELSKIRTLMLIRMHQVLSPEQRQKLKALHKAEREKERTSDRRR